MQIIKYPPQFPISFYQDLSIVLPENNFWKKHVFEAVFTELMEQEKEIITRLLGKLPLSPDRLNKSFESDAEILKYGSGRLLFTVDEFSSEDHFRDNDPYLLGWNLAAGTISDILASGGEPYFYAHSLSLDENWDLGYLDCFAQGIADVLKRTGAYFIGGDTGTSEKWHYTGIAMGNADTPMMRIGAAPGDVIYLTGEIGAGNLEAGLNHYSQKPLLRKLILNYKTELPLRLPESRLIREYATSCIDTSDGVLNSLVSISELNHTGVMIGRLPYISTGLLACKMLSRSKLCLFAGECGEYELLFSIPKPDVKYFESAAKKRGFDFHRLGEVTKERTIKVLQDGKKLDFSDFNISARSFNNIHDYLEELEEYLSRKTSIGITVR